MTDEEWLEYMVRRGWFSTIEQAREAEAAIKELEYKENPFLALLKNSKNKDPKTGA